MVSGAAPALTKIGFRRDVKLFLTVLVGFLAFLVLGLLFLLQTFMHRAEDAEARYQRSVANVVAEELSRRADDSPQALQTTMSYLQSNHAIAGIELERRGLPTVREGAMSTTRMITRPVRGGTVRIAFDDAATRNVRTIYIRTAIISIAGMLGGILLLTRYVPRVTRPIEQMLDEARQLGERAAGVAEDHYLIETFKNSIATLKAQELELKRLHDLQKTRADELERVTATLTRSLTSGFISIGPDGTIVDLNSAARAILGLDGDAPYGGRAVDEALPAKRFREILRQSIRDRLPLTRYEVLEEGEPARVIGLTTVPLLGDDGNVLGLLALFTDLTPIRGLEERVRQMQTLADLGEIAGGIAHEFRNSLSTIGGYLRLAQRHEEVAEALVRVKKAEDEVNVLSRTVDALLGFARPMSPVLEPVDVGALVRDVATRVMEQHPSTRLELRAGEVMIEGDRALLSRAIENLVRNAAESVRDSGRENGLVEVAVANGSHPTITIRDNGAGIDPARAAKIFLPFETSKSNGLGLGLPLARKIILLHGGDLRLQGAPGEGAAAVIDFPSPES